MRGGAWSEEVIQLAVGGGLLRFYRPNLGEVATHHGIYTVPCLRPLNSQKFYSEEDKYPPCP